MAASEESPTVANGVLVRHTLRVGDVVCETVKDDHFRVLRRVFAIPDSFLVRLSMVVWTALAP